MSFNSSGSQIIVHGHAINNVEGSQVNNSQTITAEVVNFSGQQEIERTEYDEFVEVKRGQIFTCKRLHTEKKQEWEWEEKDGESVRKNRSAQRTICTVQVRPDQQAKYTAVIYEGDDAHVWWKRDFEHFSCAGLGTPEVWQLYGLNHSKIPLLIFHDGSNQVCVVELVPLANFYKKSFLGDFYVYMLKEQLNCGWNQIWLNMEGNLCKGLDGPCVWIGPRSTSFYIIVPLSVQMLQEDIFVNFLQQSFSLQLDQRLLEYASRHQTRTYLDELLPKPKNSHDHSLWTVHSRLKTIAWDLLRHPPLDIIDGLRFDTVYSTSRGAVAKWPGSKGSWKAVSCHGLVDGTDMGDGLICFKLDDPSYVHISIKYAPLNFVDGWLVQSSRIVDAHGMLGMDKRYFIVHPPTFKLYTPWFEHQQYPMALEDRPPIYLFFYPPLSISELISWEKGHTQTYFWSFDENGQSEMSEEECRQWGIPELCMVADRLYRGDLWSWPTDIYTALCKLQVARGFDPTTVDWAQSLGYSEWEIVGGKEEEARFEGVHDWHSYLRKLREQYTELQLGPPVLDQENKPFASSSDEQGTLPEQKEPLLAQETPKEETKKASWWSMGG
ncbi:hypothetical protein VNI00_018958 [Paramarasmius palmivorus]|uniref:Uncharacterized protein n=1 Tax=Paramarasmius palmivorus TaxID=297713 RepID=A0AAW0AT23_9AGAR